MTLEEYRELSEDERMRARANSLAQVAMLPNVAPAGVFDVVEAELATEKKRWEIAGFRVRTGKPTSTSFTHRQTGKWAMTTILETTIKKRAGRGRLSIRRENPARLGETSKKSER